MKPEIVSEEDLKRTVGKVYDENCQQGYAVPCMMMMAARAVLSELDVRYVFDSNGRTALVEVPEEGAMLVKAWKP